MKRSIVLALLCALASCTSQQVGQESPQVVDPVTNATLQFAVGTYYQDPSSPSLQPPDQNPGLNIVGTFRNPAGNSAVLDDVVTVFGPQSYVAYPGTAPFDGGLPNQILKSLGATQLFGDSFGLVNPALDANLNVSDPKGQTGESLAPYVGGPPAWPSTTGGLYPQQLYGYPESVITGPVLVGGVIQAPVVGSWQLQVSVPMNTANYGSLSPTMTASATLKSLAHLPLISQPTFVPDGNGGGTLTLNVPAGVTEAFVDFTVENELCYPPPAVQNPEFNAVPYFYTLMTRTTGPQTLVLPDNLGPPAPKTGRPLPTMCTTADNQTPLNPNGFTAPYPSAAYTFTAVGVDYPAYEMSYPQSKVPNPAIAGANGQADVTISKSVGPLNYP